MTSKRDAKAERMTSRRVEKQKGCKSKVMTSKREKGVG